VLGSKAEIATLEKRRSCPGEEIPANRGQIWRLWVFVDKTIPLINWDDYCKEVPMSLITG